MQVIDEKWLEAWQDAALERARRVLKLQKRVIGTVEVLAVKALVEPKIREKLQALRPSVEFRDAPEDQLCLLVAPATQFHDDSLCVEAIRDLVLTPEGRDSVNGFLGISLALAERANVPNPWHSIKNALLSRLGLHEKDVWAAWFKDFLRRSGALAYVKIDEAYTLNIVAHPGKTHKEIRAMYPRDLSDCEAASECLTVALESKLFCRNIDLPFTRTVRNTGRVRSWGEQRVLDSRKGAQLGGRFYNLLAKDEQRV